MAYWHVRIKTRFPNFKKANGTLTDEWDFITEAATQKLAGRKVVEQVFGDRLIAQVYVRNVEIWPANRLRASAR